MNNGEESRSSVHNFHWSGFLRLIGSSGLYAGISFGSAEVKFKINIELILIKI